MKGYVTLLLTLLRAHFGLSALRYTLRKEPRKRWRALGILLLIVFAVIPLFWALLQLLRGTHETLTQMGNPYLIVTLALLVSQAIIFIFGLFYLLSAFYLSHDRETLLALPLKPLQVLGAKFSQVLISEYLTTLPFLLPILIYFGILEKADMGYWLTLTLVFLLLPVLPLALSALLLVLLMRVVNLGRHKDKLIVVGSLLLIAFSIFLQMKLPGIKGDDSQMVSAILAPNGLVSLVGERFPLALWATRMLQFPGTGPGLSHGVLYVGSSLLLAFLFMLVGQKAYYSGLIGLSESSRRRHNGGPLSLGQGGPVTWSLFLREWRMMNRIPMFLLNGSLAVLYIPVLLGVMLHFKGGSQNEKFLSFLLNNQHGPFGVLAAAAFLVFCSSFNGIASTAISREGRWFWISRVIPVAPERQIKAKLLHSSVLGLAGLLAGTLSLHWSLNIPPTVLSKAFLLAFPAMLAFGVVGLLIDLMRPKLTWTSPQQAIKQNLNAFLHLVAVMLILLGLGYSIGKLKGFGISPDQIPLLFGLFFVLLFLGLWTWLHKLARGRYDAIGA